MSVDRSRDSHAFANMLEHMFLAELLQHMWVEREQVLEVAKAEVDSWGYDVVLSTGAATRYVQLKTKVPAEVNLRLIEKRGACVIATIPQLTRDAVHLTYRFWQPSRGEDLTDREPARRKVYRRGMSERDARKEHRIVRSSEFSGASGMTIKELASALFPK